jgi:hypothetical protein
MKLRANYKYIYMNVDWTGNVLDSRSPVVSCFLLEVVMLVGVVRKNQ